jgi:hypothetical protein
MFPRVLANLSLAFVIVVSASYAAASAAPARAGQTWLVASDIHLDPFDKHSDPSLFGSDTNLALFRSVLAEMKRRVPDPSVVLLPGDFFAHGFGGLTKAHPRNGSATEEGLRVMRYIAGAFAKAYPHAQFAIALGNNDAPCGDYRSELGSPYLAAVTRIWAPLVDRAGAAPEFATAFPRGGYYAATLPASGLRLIVLNDVLYSSVYFGNCGANARNAGKDELAWLQHEFERTPPGRRNVVMMHIPPGYDVQSTQTTRGFLPWMFLKSGYNDQLLAALSAPADRVAFAIAGHTHRFDFRIDGAVPIVVVGAISPVYHDNPAFYALQVEGGALRDIDVYAYDEWTQEWQPPRSIDRKWGVGSIDAASLIAIHARLENDAAMRHAWDAGSSGWPSNWQGAWGMWGPSWRIAWCAQTSLDGNFASCAGIVRRARFLQISAVAALLGGIVLIWFVVVVFVRIRRRRRV